MPDWTTLDISSTAVHYVETLKDTDAPQLLLTTETIDLDSELTQYFRGKIAGRLNTKGLEVIEDPSQPDIVPQALLASLAEPKHLLADSRTIAQQLFDVQGKTNSSGLLAVVAGTIGKKREPCVALMKLERQRGVSFQIDEVTGTVDLELLRNLTLTDKTKVYKTALFLSRNGSLTGYVADDQRTSARGASVAGFFLGDFLGCQPKELAAEVTYKFVKAANRAINTLVESPETKGRYLVALLSTMQDNSTDLRPATFIAKHLEAQHQKLFYDVIAEAGIDPKVPFHKDVSLVKVDQFKMSFESGMVLVGPAKTLDTNVRIPKDDDGPVVLDDDITSLVSGR